MEWTVEFIGLADALQDFPGGASGKELVCQCDGFDPWVGKIPWRKVWQPTPVFLPRKSPWIEESRGYSPWGCKDMTGD